jgi:hypothetical protein
LAAFVLGSLGLRMAFLADRSGSRCFQTDASIGLDEGINAFMIGCRWGRLTYKHSHPDAPVRFRFAECARGLTYLALAKAKQEGELSGGGGQIRSALEESRVMVKEAIVAWPAQQPDLESCAQLLQEAGY